MIKEKEEEGARPSKINGSINKARCCARAGVPAHTWATGVCVCACVPVWVRASGKGRVAAAAVVGGLPRKAQAVLRAHGRHVEIREHNLNLFADVRRVWSTLWGVLLLNTSCLLQSAWSRLHYWYNQVGWGGGLRGPGSDGERAHSLSRSPECVWRESASCWELRGKLGQIWN